ncbi:alpha/beta fold hydrolase [Actinopolymorpha pittospori]|uniref:Pimeloyl-ACP methyl ester carboxylesterase n=1 Tax=Actinopolymorpha pittospori TaxID=648752 RepID=A0A927REG8_9ACTN|nr:pimeloyl-ACP methyl ester carboxylesterase [Actinopolymorpha pittospori]
MRTLGGGRRTIAVAVLLAVALSLVVLGLAGVRDARSASGTVGAGTNGAVGAAAPACAAKPTIVLVHGAWANTSSWNGEVTRLQRDGYVARAVSNPLRDLTSDAASVAAFLDTIPGPIVLVGHSYGGAVITNAAAGNPNVKALVYVDAAAPAVGESTGELSGKTSALSAKPSTLYDTVPRTTTPTGDTDLYLKETPFLRSFGPDLPRRTAQALWASQNPAAMNAFTTPSTAAAWKTIPSWYVFGTADRIITPQSLTFMAHRAHARIKTVPGGSHLTLISHPQPVTDQILAAARATCPKRR